MNTPIATEKRRGRPPKVSRPQEDGTVGEISMQVQRKKAPAVTLTDYSYPDERQKLIRLYAKDCIMGYRRDAQGRVIAKIPPAFRAACVEPSEVQYKLDCGYVHIKDSSDKPVRHKGDFLMKRPWAEWNAEVEDAAKRSDAVVRQNRAMYEGSSDVSPELKQHGIEPMDAEPGAREAALDWSHSDGDTNSGQPDPREGADA